MSKPSRHITGKQATAYFAAMKHAQDQAEPPNLSITLNLSCTDCPPGEASPVMQQLPSLLVDPQTYHDALLCSGFG